MPSSSRRRWPPLSTCRVQRAARCPPASTTDSDCRSGPVRPTSRSSSILAGLLADHDELRGQRRTTTQPAGQHVGTDRLERLLQRVDLGGEVLDDPDAVVADPGQARGQAGGGDPHVRGPGSGAALQRDRGRDLAGHVGVAVDGDDAAGRLEVDEHVVAVAVDAQADQRGVGDSPRRPPLGRLEVVAHPGRAVVVGAPLADRGGDGGASWRVTDVVVQPHGVHRRQRRRGLAAGCHQVAQGAVEELGARRGRRTAELGLDVARHRRRRRSGGGARRPAPRARSRHSRPVPSSPPGISCTPCSLMAAAPLQRRCPAADRASGAEWRPLRRRGHPVHADGVVGHDQVPAGLDQPRQLELAAVGLDQALVQLVDLPVAAAVAQQPLGDVPEVVVVAVLGRRHRVDLVPDQVLLRGDLVRGPALGSGLVGVGGAACCVSCTTLAAATSAPECSRAPSPRPQARRSPRPAAAPRPGRARASAPDRRAAPAGPARRGGPRTTSTATQTTKNSQASQTTNSSTLSRVVKVSWPVSVSLVGSDVGNGSEPASSQSTAGTPTTRPSSASAESARLPPLFSWVGSSPPEAAGIGGPRLGGVGWSDRLVAHGSFS